jgi:hypothetical protein
MPTHDRLLARIRGEYSEMPGLRLTTRQACRLWHLEEAICVAVLEELVEEHFLYRQYDDTYAAWPSMRPKPVKAALPATSSSHGRRRRHS